MCRKSIYLFLLMAVFVGSAHAQFITSVAHRNTDSDAPEDPEIAPNPLDEDELTFVDRTHQYNDIPAYLIGAQYVMTANDNKNQSAYELDVTVAVDCTLYVFVDNRMGSSDGGQGVDPDITGMAWLDDMGFEDTGDDIGIDESGDGDIDQYSSVFAKSVSAGSTTTVRGNTQGHGGNMLGVAAMGPRLKARNPIPDDGAIHTGTYATCQWTAGDTAASHDVYFGDNYNDVAAGAGGTFRANLPLGTEYFFAGLGLAGDPYPDGLVPGTDYYWRIDEVEADGTKQTGDIWGFSIPSTKATEPSPADGSAFVDRDVTLSWKPGFGAVFHHVYFGDNPDDVAAGTPDTDKQDGLLTSFVPGTLEYDKTYYWRVDELDEDSATHTGDVWSFTTVPDIAITDPDLLCWWKFDEGSGTAAVDWSGHGHHGTLEGDPQWVEGTVGGALDFSGGNYVIDGDAGVYMNGLSALTVTLWIKSDVIGTDSGFIIFENPQGRDTRNIRYDQDMGDGLLDGIKYGTCVNPGDTDDEEDESPANVQTTEWQHIAVTWASGAGDFPVGLKLYINGVLQTPSTDEPGAEGVLTGYDRVVVGKASKDEDATEGWDGLIDDVRIYNKALTAEEIKEVMRGEPDLAWEPKPANGSVPDIKEATPLSWSPGDNASQHDVYFGADKDAVADADTSTAGIYRGRQGATSYTPPEGVEWGGGPYYWRIDEYNTDGTISKGRVWRFSVAEFLLVDDFELYKGDEVPVTEQIWGVWRDGLGFGAEGVPPYSPGNGTGSEVGDAGTDSYTEESITHDGSDQSMPYWFNNNKTDKFKYSEAKRTVPAGLRNWSAEGVKALSLWFRGYPASTGSFVEAPAGTYTMTASGTDIFGASDEFHYAYKQLTGVATIVAKVESVEYANAWSKAGVMIRDTLDAGSKFAAVYITPTNTDGTATYGCRFQARADTDIGATSDSSVATPEQTAIIAPYWVKLERDVAGNFTGYYSSNGTTWQPMSWNPQNIQMDANVYIGLAVTSHDAALTCEAVFSNVTITGNLAGQWMHQDIGIESNDAEPMYVAIANNTGQPAVVYHDDPAATTIDIWTEWPIDLKDFADKGINLADVNSIAIGFGDRNNPTAGGAGKMYFDDIRLYQAGFRPEKVTFSEADLNRNGVVDFADIGVMAADWLNQGGDGLWYEYSQGTTWSLLPDFDIVATAKQGVVNNFDIGVRNQNDNFGFRFSGQINIAATGAYTFYTISDDGSQLFIDGAMLVDNDGLHGMVEQSGTVTLTAGLHDIVVTMFEAGGGEGLDVEYEGPGIVRGPIPDDVLSLPAPVSDLNQDGAVNFQDYAVLVDEWGEEALWPEW